MFGAITTWSLSCKAFLVYRITSFLEHEKNNKNWILVEYHLTVLGNNIQTVLALNMIFLKEDVQLFEPQVKAVSEDCICSVLRMFLEQIIWSWDFTAACWSQIWLSCENTFLRHRMALVFMSWHRLQVLDSLWVWVKVKHRDGLLSQLENISRHILDATDLFPW